MSGSSSPSATGQIAARVLSLFQNAPPSLKRPRPNSTPGSPSTSLASTDFDALVDSIERLIRGHTELSAKVDEQQRTIEDLSGQLVQTRAQLAEVVAGSSPPPPQDIPMSSPRQPASSVAPAAPSLTDSWDFNAETPEERDDRKERSRALVLSGLPPQPSSSSPMTAAKADIFAVEKILDFLGVPAAPVAVYRLPSKAGIPLTKIIMPSSEAQQRALRAARSLRFFPGYERCFLRPSLTLAQRGIRPAPRRPPPDFSRFFSNPRQPNDRAVRASRGQPRQHQPHRRPLAPNVTYSAGQPAAPNFVHPNPFAPLQYQRN